MLATRNIYPIVTVELLLHAAPAEAYIDPGTGSAIFYVITGLVVSIYFGVRSLYYRALELILRTRHADQHCDMAVHCEHPRYEITFLPIVRLLAERGIGITFFSMYPRNESFDVLPSGVAHRQIAPGLIGYAYLNRVDATVLLTTTPQLDVMTFRRSSRVKHYVMVQHALGESRYVRPFAYDYFDTVLCCGPILKENIRRMEAIRNSRAKRLLDTGLPHYEDLIQRAHQPRTHSGLPVVLIAPSWGPLSMFEAFGTEFVEAIARRFAVIVRPHPQMEVSQPELFSKITSLRGVEVDVQRTPASSMCRAQVLLSDISGITHEFAFIYERPVVVIDRAMQEGGLEGEVLGGDSELKEACSEFIVPVPPSEMSNIVAHLERALKDHSAERIAKLRAQLIYNFGKASRVAADQLEGMIREAQSAIPPKTIAHGKLREQHVLEEQRSL